MGDITPHDGVSDAEKYSLEAAAIQKMRETLGTSVVAGDTGAALLVTARSIFNLMMQGFDQSAGEEIEQLWHEYEQGQTPAAQMVKDFDKVLLLSEKLTSSYLVKRHARVHIS